MRVLAAGGAGFIGSHMCKALSAARHTHAVRSGPLEVGESVRDPAPYCDVEIETVETAASWHRRPASTPSFNQAS